MVVAVTGATGHVGANLVRELVAQGRTVRALVFDRDEALAGVDVEIVRGDVRDPESLRGFFEGADTVFHLAAYISVLGGEIDRLTAINVEGVRNVMQACVDAGVKRVVHFSSIHALADVPKGRPINETCDLALGDKHLEYDRTKAAGESVVAEFVAAGLDVVTINPGAIIGREDWGPSAMGQVLLDLYSRRVPALVEGGFAWVDVRDVVQAALQAETHGKTGERYLIVGHWASFKELAELVEQVTGKRTPKLVTPLWAAQMSVPMVVAYSKIVGRRPLFTAQSLQVVQHHKNVDCKKACDELEFVPRELADTVEDAFAWFRDHGRLS